MPLAAGQSLSFYEILGPLGAGGMGEVYRARDTRLEREVAIKVLPDELADDEERLRRFEREAKTLASLSHTNVAHVYGIDQVDDTCFIAMELVAGEDLETKLGRGRMAVEESVDVCRQIAEGLEAAHEAGVVHRDLKPANVRITPEGVVKILDFGLAKPIHPRATREGATAAESDSFLVTEEGLVLGTPTYMSPEQARGKVVDRRTDIWAFGCVLYECLTGERAFGGESFTDVVAAIVGDEPDASRLPAMPPRVRELLDRCLEKDPRRRLRDIGEARLQLEPGAIDEGAPAEERSSSSAIRSALFGSLLGAAAGGALVLAVLGFTEGGDEARVRDLHLSVPASAEYGRPTWPKISPDGTTILFTAFDEDGKRSLWLRSFDAFEARAIPGTDDARYSFWSPDGDSIGFYRDGATRTLRLGEEVPRSLPVIEGFRWGRWSLTGEIVLGGPEAPLCAVPVTGGEPRAVTRLDTAAGEVSHSLPTFLPDGDRFLYLAVMLNPNSGEVWEHRLCVGSLSSGESAVLGPFPSRPYYSDRGEIVYVDDGMVRAVPFDASSLEFTGEARTLASGVAYFKSQGRGLLSVARNGSFAFQPATSRSLTWLDQRGIDRGRVGGSTHTSFGYRISPDGRHVALGVTDPMTHLSDVWVWGLTRETRTQVTDAPSWEGSPVWTPDGRGLLYASGSEGYPDVFKISLEPPTTPELVWGREGSQMPDDITDNGETLLLSDLGGIWELSLVGESEPVELVGAADSEGRASPDGRWVAYSSARSGQGQVYLLERGASRREFQITVDGGNAPRWDPREGERSLYYVRQENQVWKVDLSTEEKVAEPEPVILFEAGKPIDRLEVMPDGERFLVRYDESRHQPISVLLRGVE